MELQQLNINLIISVIIVNILAFATGNAYAWSSTVLMNLKSSEPQKNPIGRPITPFEESWIASLLSLGAAIGPFLAGYCSDKIGRKKTLLIFSAPMMASHVILAFANSTREYFLARFMMGLGAGCVFTVIPIYVGEIAETKIRGILGCIMGIFFALGLLFVYSIGSFLNIVQLSFILIVPIFVFVIFFGWFVPESPYFYMAIGDEKAAELSLNKLRKSDRHSKLVELAIIKKDIENSKSDKSFTFMFKAKSFRKGIIITTTIMVFQQFIGITILLSYMESIFIATGSSLSSSTSTIAVSVIQCITVICSSLLVDKWGRKIMLVLASIVCAISSAIIGVFFYLKHIEINVSELWWLPILGLMIYMIGYNLGLGVLPWVLVGELFSSKTKAFASTFTAFTCLFLAFVTTLIFPALDRNIGFHGTFWIFSISAVFCLFFVLYYVPETKGKSFQAIFEILER